MSHTGTWVIVRAIRLRHDGSTLAHIAASVARWARGRIPPQVTPCDCCC
jgi:hypothetical protein